MYMCILLQAKHFQNQRRHFMWAITERFEEVAICNTIFLANRQEHE